MRKRRTLGRRLAGIVGLSTLAGLISFALATYVVLWIDDDEASSSTEESPLDELLEHLAFALAFAAPIGITVAVIGGTWSTRRALARVDTLIATAGRVDLDNLGFRLPESAAGDELDALTGALNSLLARIDGGVVAQRRFAADASHELRTPLTVMINSLEVARRRRRTIEEWERIVDDTLIEARRLADLAEALLQTSSVGAHASTTAMDVDAETCAIVERWLPRATAVGIELVIRASTGAAIGADARALGIVVGNLIDNAIRHSPPGSAIDIETTATTTHVQIAVDDRGPGVPEHERISIFAPFVRGATQRDGAGVGLGLAIVKRICQSPRVR